MPVNRQTVRELSRTTLYNITSSGQAWRAFLDAAARLYKYSFPEQVLIYAQEPEATACAAKEVWYTRMKRSLRPDAQAIALPDPHSHFGRLKYVFDVRETQPLPGAPEFRQWSLPFEALERVTDRLGPVSYTHLDVYKRQDLDTTIKGFTLTHESIRNIFAEICAIGVADDVTFEITDISDIREGDDYPGKMCIRDSYLLV